MASLERYAEVAAALSGGRDADGHRQHHRAHGGRLHRRQCAPDRRSARNSVFGRCSRPKSFRGPAARCAKSDVARRLMHYAVTGRDRPEAHRRSARHASRIPPSSRTPKTSCVTLQAQHHRPELPDLRRPRADHRAQQRALRPRHRHPGDLRAARRGPRRRTRSTWARNSRERASP